MRQVLSLSLPAETVLAIKKTAKDRGFSVSEFIKNLFIENTEDVITEEELLRISLEAEKNYKEGKIFKLNSLRDLM